jgi:hypothetical protein
MDGVLRTETRVPIFEGLYLYKSLNDNTSVFLACDDLADGKRWAKEHRLKAVDGFITNADVGDYENKDWLKVQHQMASGPIYMVVTADIELAKTCIENGVKAFLFLHPIYLSAKFRPDGRTGKKSWADLVEELDKQLELRLDDKRL